jgi:hypothetical protein
VARTGRYPLRDSQILFWVRVSLKIASLSEERIVVFEFVSFCCSHSERQTLSLSGAATLELIARFINEAYPLRPKSWAALLATALGLPVL